MKLFRTLASFSSIAILVGILISAAPLEKSLVKKRVLADLDTIQNIFEVKYAPKYWKQEFAQWDLTQAIEDAKNKVKNHPAPTMKECQVILRDFFNSTKDYHVGVRFFSTESASLPFIVKGAQGRFFICYVDRDSVTEREFPFVEGDEILFFDDSPIAEVIDELRLKEYGSNTIETDQALAEMSLTQRCGDMGHAVPSGKVKITGMNKGKKTPITVTLNWMYRPEKIQDFSNLGQKVDIQTTFEKKGGSTLNSLFTNRQFFEKFMVAYFWDKSYAGSFTEMNKHAIGARSSFIPPLGKKLWKSTSDAIFDAYIFETQSGKKIGYIRLPHYGGDEEEVVEFGLTINHFQKRTDALIIDQVNNPGGSVFYLYALAATLADKPFCTPKHRIALTQDEVYFANSLIPYLDQISDDETARIVLGETMGGYPVDFQFAKLMKRFCQFITKQWESGKLFSDPTYLFGVDEIHPHPKYRYTKPIVLLINSLDFSGGDFFPAILQDNKRATIIGTRTAGAGGYVLSTNFPNHSGIKGFLMTGSLAERMDQRPIENLGVRPDIQLDLTIDDLQGNYKGYSAAILETIESLAKKS